MCVFHPMLLGLAGLTPSTRHHRLSFSPETGSLPALEGPRMSWRWRPPPRPPGAPWPRRARPAEWPAAGISAAAGLTWTAGPPRGEVVTCVATPSGPGAGARARACVCPRKRTHLCVCENIWPGAATHPCCPGNSHAERGASQPRARRTAASDTPAVEPGQCTHLGLSGKALNWHGLRAL
jgi:hypothetical protein